MTDRFNRYTRWFSSLFAPLSLESNVRGAPHGRLRSGAPLVDRFGGLLSVLFEDEERGLFLMNQGEVVWIFWTLVGSIPCG